MAVHRTFRGRLIKRTKRRGSDIVIFFRSERKGEPGAKIIVPIQVYLAEAKRDQLPNRGL